MKDSDQTKLFGAAAARLKQSGYVYFAIKIIELPVGLMMATCLTKIVTFAMVGDSKSVIVYGVAVLLFFAAGKMVQFLLQNAFGRLESRCLHGCKMHLYKQILSNPLSALCGAQSGGLLENITNDFEQYTSTRIRVYPVFWFGILSATGYFAFIGMENLWIALTLLGLSLLQLLPPMIVKKFLQVNYDQTREIEAELTDATIEAYDGLAEIKQYGAQPWYMQRLKALHIRYQKIGNRSELAAASQSAMNAFVENLLRYGMYGAIGLYALANIATIETGIAAIAVSAGLYEGVKAAFDSIPKFALSRVAQTRLQKWCGSDHRAECMTNGDIDLQRVRFGYDGHPILRDADIHIAENRVTLLHGDNGSGKTTLLQLMIGALQPSGGLIRVGGCRPEHIAHSEWGRGIFYVPQFDAPYELTIDDLFCVLFDGPDDSPVAITAMLDEFDLAEQRKSGAKLSELSGGERKKVYLCIALLLDPRILILDEPTNSLDSKAVASLIRNVKRRTRTTVIVSHDPVFREIASVVYCVRKGVCVCENHPETNRA